MSLMNRNEQSRLIAGAAVGAVAGTALAYLFFTDTGRVMRDALQRTAEELAFELNKVKHTIRQVEAVAAGEEVDWSLGEQHG